MKRSNLAVGVCGVLFLAAVGCNPAKTEAPAPASQAQPAAPLSQAGDPLSGKVVETMNSAGYTYVCIEQSGRKTWIAIPESKIKVGQEMAFQPGAEMKNFTSKTLNRTFESIIFSAGIR